MGGRYVFNLIMLGILLAQVWHWYSWTKKEKTFIRIIVVSSLHFLWQVIEMDVC